MQNFDMLFGNGLLFVFVILEALVIKFKLKKELPINELIMNLNSGHILLWVFRSLEVTAYAFVFHHFSTNWAMEFPCFFTWILAFFLWDFMFYWLHRTHHLWKILWGIHVVHHEGEHFSLSLGIRNSWYSSLSSFPYFIIMALIGIRPEIFVTVSSFHYFIQFYNHNHLIKNSGFLDKFMVTPKHHRIHHGKNDPYIDKNFGGTLLIWDKIFGTFQKEDPANPVQIGISHAVDSNNPLFVNNVPFAEMFRDNYNFDSPKKEGIKLPNYMLISGAITLFSMLLSFIFFQHSISPNHAVILFFTVFLGTLANGFLLDGHKIGFIIWAISNIISPCYMLIMFNDTNNFFKIILSIFIIHGIYTLYYLLSKSMRQLQNKVMN